MEIIGTLKEAEEGAKAGDLAPEHDIGAATIYNWCAKLEGMDVSEAKRLKGLEDVNRRLKQVGAELLPDKEVLESALSKKVLIPVAKREAVEHFRECFDLSERRACELAAQSRPTLWYASRKQVMLGLEEQLTHHRAERPWFGGKRRTILLRRDGFFVTHKRVCRMYTERALAVRRKQPSAGYSRGFAPGRRNRSLVFENDSLSLDLMRCARTGFRPARVPQRVRSGANDL